MSDHKIVWTHVCDHVEGRAVCEAPEGSNCRIYCDQGCESYSIKRDELGPHHLVETFTDEPIRHDMVPYDGCVVVDWLNSDPDMLPEMRVGSTDEFTIGQTPINPAWEGDYYAWEATNE